MRFVVSLAGRALRIRGTRDLPKVAIAIVCVLAIVGCGDMGGSKPEPAQYLMSKLDRDAVTELLATRRAMPLGEAYEAAILEPDPFLQHLMLSEVYARVDRSNFSEVRDVFIDKLGHATKTNARVFGNLWGKVDPIEGLSTSLSWTRPLPRRFVSEEVLSVWAARTEGERIHRDFRAMSTEWDEAQVRVAERSLSEALARHGRWDTFVKLIGEMTEQAEHRTRAVAAGLREIRQVDAEGPLKLGLQLVGDEDADPSIRTQIILQAIQLEMAMGEVDKVIAWYEEHLSGQSYAGDALNVMADQWSRTDPEAALDYVLERPDAENPRLARRAVAYIWLQNDPKTADAFLSKAIDEDPRLEPVLLPLAQYHVVEDAERAMKLSLRMEDRAERESFQKRAIVRFIQRRRSAAEKFLAENEVSDIVRRAAELGKTLRAGTRVQEASPNP